MAKANELVKTEERPIARETVTDQLLQMAVDKNLDIDKLQKLIDMKHDEEERLFRRDFDLHFSKMQQDYLPAKKSGSVMNKDRTKLLYKFCPLENILKVYAPIISRHGFSFRFSEEMISEKTMRVTCIISGWGHVERNSAELPVMAGNDFTNSLQQTGVSRSYGKRYAFMSGFGVIIDGEDEDGKIEPKVKQESPVEKKDPPKVVDPDSAQGKFDAIVSDIKGFLHSRVHMEELKWTVEQLKAFAFWKDIGINAKKTFDCAPVELILLKLKTFDKLRQFDKEDMLLKRVIEAVDAEMLQDIAEIVEHEAKENGEQLEIF